MVDSVYGKGWGVAASALLLALIHPSSWKDAFSEVQIQKPA
jgi:hypothetical protein